MSERDEYPIGVPCWVENLVDDVQAAKRFYSEIFGWDWHGRSYCVALLDGREVAGVGPAPPDVPAAWATQVRVSSAGESAERAERAGGTIVAGPFDVLPAGRVAVLADPTGATIGAFEPHERRGAQKVNESGAWALSILSSPDPEASAAFYAAVFGWQAMPFEGATMFRVPGYVGGTPDQPVPRDVVAAMREAPAPARWDVDFWIPDVDAATRTAEAGGGRVLAPVRDVPPFRRAVLADPAGAAFSVSQLAVPEA